MHFVSTGCTNHDGRRVSELETNPMKLLRSTVTALTAAAMLAVPAAFAADEHKDHAKGKDPMTEHISKLSGKEFEAGFLAMMIHHHESGVKMAKLAQEKAQSPDLKEMSGKMQADQSKEIAQMTGWLKEWHQQTPSAHKMPEGSMRMMEKDMAALQVADGKEFDKLFASQMAHHHMGAIEMAKLAVDKAEHQEVKDLAKKIISTQSEEHEKLLKKDGK